MKRTVKKCACGRVSDPVHLSIVKDAWVKNGFAFFQYDCPQCKRDNTIKIVWDER